MEPVMEFAFALGAARTTAQNAAAHRVGIVLLLRFILFFIRFELITFRTLKSCLRMALAILPLTFIRRGLFTGYGV
jgi:hypothetical protein